MQDLYWHERAAGSVAALKNYASKTAQLLTDSDLNLPCQMTPTQEKGRLHS